MRPAVICLFIYLFTWPALAPAQSVPQLSNPSSCGLGLPIQDDNCPEDRPIYQPNVFDIVVSNAPGSALGVDVYLREVRLIIRHPWLNDLDISLRSPGGVQIELSSDNGGGNDHYGNPDDEACDSVAVFRAAACLRIADATPPYTEEALRPETSFYELMDGTTDPNGTWQLIICDDVEDDAGALEFVHLVFEPIDCLPILEIDEIQTDATRATVNWAPGDLCGITILEYGPPGFTPGVDSLSGPQGRVEIYDGCPPYTLTGLPELSTLDLYIRRYCPASGLFSGNTCGDQLQTGCRPPPVTMETTFDNEDLCATSCDAECSLTGFWRNSPTSSVNWLVHSGPVATQGTGPEADVNGGGRYVYLETSGSSCPAGSEAQLLSGCFELDKQGSDTCHFSFNYHMNGSSVDQLRLEASDDGGFSWQTIWQRSGEQGDQWYKTYLSLQSYSDGDTLQLRFIARKGNGFRGDIALDHLVLYGSRPLGFPDRTYYVDADSDGYGTAQKAILSCRPSAPAGYTDNALDCDDTDPDINPGREESPCDGIDDNCNGLNDDQQLPPPPAIGDTICSGAVAEICATASPGFLIAWYDSPNLENLISIGNCFQPELPPNNSPEVLRYTFYAVETNFTCSSAQPTAVPVVIQPQPGLRLADLPPAICRFDTFSLASLNIVDDNFTNGQLSYHTGSPAGEDNVLADPLVVIGQDTAFYAMMTTASGCRDEIRIDLLVSPPPTLTFDPGRQFSLCRNSQAAVSVSAQSPAPPYEYFWNTGQQSAQIIAEAGAQPGQTATYTLTVTDSEGCISTDSVIVETSLSIDSIFRQVTHVTTCQGTEGRISLAPLNGVPPYTYQWSGSNGISGTASSALDTFTIGQLPQGAYRITVTDNSSEQCSFLLRNVLVQGPGAAVQQQRVHNLSCGGAGNGRIELDVIGNAPVYQWSNGMATSTISGLSAGLYSVTISDGPCTTVLTDIEVTEPPDLGLRFETTDPSCAQSNDGKIKVAPFGGSGVYSYRWNTGGNGQQLSGLPQGRYMITLTDGRSCTYIDSISLTAPPMLSVSLDSLRSPTCAGYSDGYLQVSAQGGIPPYRYRWDAGSTLPALFNAGAGMHTVEITDFNGCIFRKSFTLTEPAPLALQLRELSPPLCSGVDDGTIEIGAAGGTPPYTLAWDDGSDATRREGLPPGNYRISITDREQCPAEELVVDLPAQQVLTTGSQVITPACVGPATGSIQLQPNGMSPFTAQWSTGASGLELSDITSGVYSLTLTDSRSCRLDTTIEVRSPQVFDLLLTSEAPSCFGVADGIAQVRLTQTGMPPFSFAWNDGATEQNRSNLEAGNYQLTVSDADGCRYVTDTIRLLQPQPFGLAAFDLESVSCHGDSTGFIEVVLSGGTSPYRINWLGQGVTGRGLYDLPAGDYRLQVFDAQDCPIDTTFRIQEPPPLHLDVDILRGDECDARKPDSLRAQAGGGISPYTYRWSSGDEGALLSNIAPGDYNVTVTDQAGCRDVVQSVKLRPRELALSLDTFFVRGISCFGASDAAMTVQISGGSGRYTYLFQPGRLFENTTADSITVSGLSLHNNYAVTITDVVTGCRIASEKITISEPPPLSVRLDRVREIRCFGGIDGSLQVSVQGGTPPYDFQWTDENAMLVSTSEDLLRVPAGRYQLLVTDANGCTVSFSDAITEVNPIIRLTDTLITAVACAGENTGAIDISAGGGNPPFQFLWSNGAMTEDLSNVPAGIYSITLTDTDTCKAIFSNLIIPQEDTVLEIDTVSVPVSCFGAADGSARVKVNGGAPPYQYAWFRNNQLIPSSNAAQLEDLPAGSYRVEIEDVNGCQRSITIEIGTPTDLIVNIQVDLPQAPDYNDGSASAIVSGGTPDYTYSWTTGDTTATITDLSAGTYGLTVTDSRGCQESVRLTLTGDTDRQRVSSVRLYPIPAGDQLTLEVALTQALAPHVVLWDGRGNTVWKHRLDRGVTHLIQIPIEELPSGVYFISMHSEGMRLFSRRVLIMR